MKILQSLNVHICEQPLKHWVDELWLKHILKIYFTNI